MALNVLFESSTKHSSYPLNWSEIFQCLWQYLETVRTSSEIFGNVWKSSKHLQKSLAMFINSWNLFENLGNKKMKISHLPQEILAGIPMFLRVKLIRAAP
jgi:hypothetical protein